MESKELIINIWFIVDIDTSLCYNWVYKVYCHNGADNEKTIFLKDLAENDYISANRINFPENFKAVFSNITFEGKIPLEYINEHFEKCHEYFYTTIEKELPKQFIFRNSIIEPPNNYDLKLPNNPLFVTTVLMENELGELRPFTTEQNKEWYLKEKQRLENERRTRNN
jgi:hypothetical protein